MIYLLDIFFYRAVFILVPSMTVKAVSRTILFKHRIWNSEFEVMHFTSFNFSPNRLLHSQQHLHSCTLIVKAIPHSKPEHQWRFSSRLESKSDSVAEIFIFQNIHCVYFLFQIFRFIHVTSFNIVILWRRVIKIQARHHQIHCCFLSCLKNIYI